MAVVANNHQITLNSSNNHLQTNNKLLCPLLPPNSSSCPPPALVDLQSPSTSAIQKSIQAFSLNSNQQTNTPKGKLWQQALQNPIKFVKSSSNLPQTQFPYEPINNPKQPKVHLQQPKSLPPPTTSDANSSPTHPHPLSICSRPNSQLVATSWTRPQSIGPGFYNTGNTCFLNATLQALVHTPAIAIGLIDREEHGPDSCRLARNKKFCALCRMYRLVNMCFDKTSQSHAIDPSPISRALSKFAPSMRGNRQEDAHEFLRLLIEAMQNGALEGQADKAKQKQKESTFVHRMFGGKLRSRVVCEHCNTPSDTFDNFLDLSLDISQANSVTSALKAYHKFDRLRGANQYKCEKCKCLRDAKKTMSVFSAPPILTLHLKRFNFRGQKINKRVNFEEALDLRPAMSEESGPAGYKLYAVVCHRGQSNKRGHYYAHIKASNGKWYLADDSTIEVLSGSRTVMANDHAYMLFYARDRESVLSAAIAGNRPSTSASTSDQSSSGSGKFVKRKPSLSIDASAHKPNSNASSEGSSAKDQDVNKNKRAKMGPKEESCEKFSTVMIPRHMLPTFKTYRNTTHRTNPDESHDQVPITTTDEPSSKPDDKPVAPSLPDQSEDLMTHVNNSADDVQGPQQPQQSKKRNRNRRQKLKNRRLVNISGTHVSNIKSSGFGLIM